MVIFHGKILIGDIWNEHFWASKNVLCTVGYINAIIWMVPTHGVKGFFIKIQKGIFSVRFVISVPRENDQIFTQKCNIFYLMTLNWSQVSASTPPKPFLDITHTLGDSNIQGYRSRRPISRGTIENMITIGHSIKNTKIVKKKPIRF